jgi:hypothetical protein
MAKKKKRDSKRESTKAKSSSIQPAKSRRHHGVVLRRGGHPKKKFSDGVRSTLKSIAKYWPASAEQLEGKSIELLTRKRSVDDFVADFEETFRRIQDHYGGVSKDANLKKKITVIHAGDTELPFYEARAYADYLGVPTGLMLLFTNCMSDITQEHEPAAVINLLKSSQAAIDALVSYLENAAKDGGDVHSAMYETIAVDKDGLEYIADLRGLAAMVAAFRSNRDKSLLPRAT